MISQAQLIGSFSDSESVNQKGFTLLEVLIAIVITALIGLGAWQIMNQAIRLNEQTQKKINSINQLQKAVLIMVRDVRQIVPRGIRDDYGDYKSAVLTDNDFYKIEFTRVGWRNPFGDVRSNIQRIAYELNEDNKLIRHYWKTLDRDVDTETQKLTLLDDVEELTFGLMNQSGAWVSEWPPEQTSDEEVVDRLQTVNATPKAMRFSIKTKEFGEIVRVVELAQYLEQVDVIDQSGESGNDNNGETTDDNNSPDQGDGDQNNQEEQ